MSDPDELENLDGEDQGFEGGEVLAPEESIETGSPGRPGSPWGRNTAGNQQTAEGSPGQPGSPWGRASAKKGNEGSAGQPGSPWARANSKAANNGSPGQPGSPWGRASSKAGNTGSPGRPGSPWGRASSSGGSGGGSGKTGGPLGKAADAASKVPGKGGELAQQAAEAKKRAEIYGKGAAAIGKFTSGEGWFDPTAYVDVAKAAWQAIKDTKDVIIPAVIKLVKAWAALMIIAICFVLYTLGLLPISEIEPAAADTIKEYPKICVDPGHPSSTSGAAGEKELNFKVASELKPALEAKGYPVFMTKSTVDENVGNQERSQKCFDNGGKYMLSLHADDTGSNTDFPYLIYANHKRGISAQSKKDAEAVRNGLLNILKDAGYLGTDLQGKANCEENVCTGATDLGVFVGGDKNNLSVDIIEMVHLVSGGSWLDDDTHRAKFVEGLVAGISAAYPPVDKSGPESGPVMSAVPYYFMGRDAIKGGRSPWADKTYGADSYCTTYAKAGCGPTSLAMVVSYFTGKDHFPDEIGDMITSKGWRPCNNGTALEAMVGIPKEFGLQSKIIPNDKNKTIEQLKKGAVVIQLHHHDFFTKGGHYIVVTGVKADGKFIIQDPNPGNYSKTKDGVDPSTVYENTGELTSWAIWK